MHINILLFRLSSLFCISSKTLIIIVLEKKKSSKDIYMENNLLMSFNSIYNVNKTYRTVKERGNRHSGQIYINW